MRRRVTIVDLVTYGTGGKYFSRMMNANYASIMPQAVAVWCAELGHEVNYICYTGAEDLVREAEARPDIVIIGAFTRSALAAYAVSNLFRLNGAVTVLGGPHARCYPEDAAKYFDYVLGFTNKRLIRDLVTDCTPQRPEGVALAATGQPADLPGAEERWPFIQPTLAKARGIKVVPMIGSMGCPYTCAFCIDSVVDYQPMGFDQITSDLRFVASRMKRPMVGWHDPNFGVRFDDYLGLIEEAVPPGSMHFVAESSLSLLSEANVKRMSRSGFVGMLPGIESWYEFGNKSRATRSQGLERVRQISDHVNMIQAHIPYVQANFVVGLDCDEGEEPFELTKKFIDLAPGAYPAFSLLTSYGRAAPMNLGLQRDGRVLPVPFQFLNSNRLSNVLPANYETSEYAHLVGDLLSYALSPRVIARRFAANRFWTVKWLNALRAGTSKRLRWQRTITELLDTDPEFAAYMEGRSSVLPPFLAATIEKQLGDLWPLLPDGAMEHDPNVWRDNVDRPAIAEGPEPELIAVGAE
jgi:hypothetical protein